MEAPKLAATKGPIVVLGFGRSGTTWISDIISKALGGLVLFEPLHPQACSFAADVCYDDLSGQASSRRVNAYLNTVLMKNYRQRWLLRNHLFTPLEEVSGEFIEAIWDECQVLGFKEIRANFMIPWLRTQLDARIVFVVRHPCAVIASIRKRANFWKEFGWDRHWQMFLERAIATTPADETVSAAQLAARSARSDLEKQAAMWAVTYAVAQAELDAAGAPFFYYEDFYERPFAASRALFSFLGHPDINMHPSHLFVPSMTTMRTVHGLTASESDFVRHGEAMFWDGVLAEGEVGEIMAVVAASGIKAYGAPTSGRPAPGLGD